MQERVEEVNLLTLMRAGWRRRKFVFYGAGIGIILAILFNNIVNYEYTVALQVTPVDTSTDFAPSGGLRDLAGLAGVNFGSRSETSPFELYLAGLQGREAADVLAKDGGLMRAMFPMDWDEENQEWSDPGGLVTGTRRLLQKIFGIPGKPWEPPSGARVQEYLARELRISRARDNSVVTVSIEVEDQDSGEQILWELHNAVDDWIRGRALERTAQYIEYVTDQMARVSVVEYREALVRILAENEKLAMVAQSGLAFAAEPFGRPISSMRPTNPVPVAILVLGLLIGGALGLTVGVILERRAGTDF